MDQSKGKSPILQKKQKHNQKDQRIYTCPNCKRGFSREGNLKNHVKIHLDPLKETSIPVSVGEKKCNICDMVFNTRNILKYHMKRRHGIEKKEYNQIKKMVSTKIKILRQQLKNKDEEEKSQSSPHCSRTIRRSEIKENHIKKEQLQKEDTATRENSLGSREEANSHLEGEGIQLSNLQENTPMDTTEIEEKKQSCPHCPKTFSGRGWMQNHIKKEHLQKEETSTRENYMGNRKEENSQLEGEVIQVVDLDKNRPMDTTEKDTSKLQDQMETTIEEGHETNPKLIWMEMTMDEVIEYLTKVANNKPLFLSSI